jgi:hypothetical protein
MKTALMKTARRALRIAVLAYLILWGYSAVIVYPGRLIQEIDSQRKDSATQGFDCAGFQGILFTTPFGTKLL